MGATATLETPLQTTDLTPGSLTRFIKANKAFWDSLLPRARQFIIPLNRQLRANAVVVPLSPETYKQKSWSTMGTAADYALGWTLGDSLEKVLERATTPRATGYEDVDALRRFVQLFLRRVRRQCDGPGVWVDTDWGPRLAKCLLLLAQMDIAVARTGRHEYMPSAEGLDTVNPARGSLKKIDAWLALISDYEACELLYVVHNLRPLLPSASTFIYNPTFGGYGPITGSDGDLVGDETLYDLKCSVNPTSVRISEVKQLLGYCALNRFNEVGLPIRRIAIINPRRRFLWSEDVDVVCAACGAGSFDEFQSQLRAFLDRCLPARMGSGLAIRHYRVRTRTNGAASAIPSPSTPSRASTAPPGPERRRAS